MAVKSSSLEHVALSEVGFPGGQNSLQSPKRGRAWDGRDFGCHSFVSCRWQQTEELH